MSLQSRYGITFGSGSHGIEREQKLRLAAAAEKMTFPEWIKNTLFARAQFILDQQESAQVKK